MAQLLEGGFSRRSFVKGAAVLTAAGIAGLEPQMGNMRTASAAEAGQEEIFSGACRCNCGGGCFLNIHVRDGQVVRTSARDLPDTSYNRICPRGLTHVGRMYGPDRLLYPMKRVGERGSGEFERISWDEAFDMIAENFQSAIDQYGPQSNIFWMGSGNYAALSGSCNSMGAYQRFVNAIGATFLSIDVDAGTGYGSARANGGTRLSNELTDRKNAKTQIIWGNNPTISLMHTMHFFMEAQEQGTKFIVIDPVYNATASKADWWIPVKGGTDGALALSVLYVLFENGWIDDDMLLNGTNAGLLIKEDGTFLRESDLGKEIGEDEPNQPLVVDADTGEAVVFSETANPQIEGVTEVQGIAVQTVYENAMGYISQYPPEVATEICGVTPEDIRELARVYHEDGPVSTEIMMGTNHYRNAHYTSWPIYLIPQLTGNVGKPGASMGQTEEYLPQYSFLPNLKNLMPEGAPGQAGTLNVCEMGDLIETGKRFDGTDFPVQNIYIHCTNPACTMPEHDYTTNWLSKVPFIVTADICMTETCRWSDLVLPSAYWFEQEDMACLFSTHPYFMWQDKAVEPLGESIADFDIWGEILNRMGLGDMWITRDEYIEGMLENDYWKNLGITLEAMREQKAMRIYPEGDVIPDVTPATETGRLQFYIENPQPSYFVGQELDLSIEHGLHWETPIFAGEDREYRKEHPFHVLSEHMRTHTHTQWSDCEYVKEYEPEPIVRLNPEDAAELGVTTGDIVKLSNTFGYCVMKVNINAGLQRGVVSAGRSWQDDAFIDGHYAGLCCHVVNPMIANHAYNDSAVKIEKM